MFAVATIFIHPQWTGSILKWWYWCHQVHVLCW